MAIIEAIAWLRELSITNVSIFLVGSLVTAVLIRDFMVWFRLRHIPGPFLNSLTIFPVLKRTRNGDLHAYMKELSDEYGPLVRISPTQVLYTDAALTRHIGSVRGGYVKGDWYDCTRLTPGQDHMLSLQDDEERRIRKAKLAAGYSGNETGNFEVGIDKQLLEFLGLLERSYISDRENHRPIDWAQRIQFFTLDVIGMIAFSIPFGFCANDKDMYNYLEIAMQFFNMASMIGHMPWLARVLHAWPFYKLLPNEGDKVGMGRLMHFSANIVDSRLAPDAKPQHDMLQSFIEHGMTRDELIQEVILQLFAGSDTTAIAIRFITLSLINNPHAYRRLQEELDEAVAAGRFPESGIISDATAKTLPYLQAVIWEGLRTWPPVFAFAGKLVPPGGEVVCGHFLPGGTQLGQNPYGAFRQKSYWGDDADSFIPERWLHAPEERLKEMYATVDVAFGSGKFVCMGRRIAFMELNKVLSELFRRYDFSIINITKPMVPRSTGGWMITDFWLRITRRPSTSKA